MQRCAAIVAVLLAGSTAWCAEGSVSAVNKPAAGLSDKVAAAMSPNGQQVTVEGKAVCTIWLAKDLAAKADFKPSLNVKYPFTPGQLIGVMEVQQKSGFTDFRGQDVPTGVYTLRYGQQPVDGNHIGTSELYDFLLAIPAKSDTDPAPIKSFEELVKKSAATAGANHPAIYSLVPVDAGGKPGTLEHDSGSDRWVLTLAGQSGGKPLPLKLIVVGKSEA